MAFAGITSLSKSFSLKFEVLDFINRSNSYSSLGLSWNKRGISLGFGAIIITEGYEFSSDNYTGPILTANIPLNRPRIKIR
jgi:hypothetical protein